MVLMLNIWCLDFFIRRDRVSWGKILGATIVVKFNFREVLKFK